MDSIKEQINTFVSEWQAITMAYSDYARSIGINYTSLQVLKYITTIEGCTQKDICERSFLPKQTVNSIITGFYKKGFVELRELKEDRRTKSIHLTEAGQKYLDSFFPHIDESEYQAMASLSEKERENLIHCIHSYGEKFREMLMKE